MINSKIRLGFILVVILLLLGAGYYIDKLQGQLKEQTNLVVSLEQDVSSWKDKDSVSYSKIRVLETERAKDFLKIQSKDSTVTALQETVKKYKRELRDRGNVTNIITETKYDTIYKTRKQDSISREALSSLYISDTISNNFIHSVFGFNGGNTHFSLQIKNDYKIVVGEERQGWFKDPIPFAIVESTNPYTEIKSLRTYQVTAPRRKRYGVGPIVGYGLNLGPVPTLGMFIGIGVQYEFIKF